MIVLKELNKYSKSQLENIFDKYIYLDEDIESILILLYRENIINYDYNQMISFNYVGMIVIKNIPIFVLPKYINEVEKSKENLMIKSIIKLLNIFSERKKTNCTGIKNLIFEREFLENNLISTIKFLLDDYIENGLYRKEDSSYELNGCGDIDWDETLNLIEPMFIKNKLIYTDFISKNIILDDSRFITKIHDKIISDCIEFVNTTGLNNILECNISKDKDDFEFLNDDKKIYSEIERELTIQFSDRKRAVLKSMKLYLDKKASINNDQLLLYGTRNFNLIWQEICEYVFDNEFVKYNNISKYEKYKIEPPIWRINGNENLNLDESDEIKFKKNRLTPDILKFTKYNGDNYLLILDAKYYNLKFKDGIIYNNPGIGDITKQYLYKKVLKKYIDENNIKNNNIINAFLFPSMEKTYYQGEIKLSYLSNIEENNIKLVQLNVLNIIEMYCNFKKYNLDNFIDMFKK